MKIKSFKVKRPFVNSTLFALFIFLAALIIHSCKKDNNQKSALAPPAIDAARAWYESNYPAPVSGKFSSLNATTVLVNGLLNYSSLVKPDWQHGASYTRYSTGVVELPIDPTSPKIASDFKNKATGKIIYKKEYSRSSFLLLYDGIKYKAYIMTIIADSAYLKNDLSKLALTTYRKRDPNFTGAVFYFTPTGSFVSSYGYKNGVLIPPAVQTATTLSASNKIARNLNLHGSKVLESAPPPTPVCLDWYYDTYEDGELISEQYLYTTCESPEGTSGSSGSSNPAPCTPPAAPPEEEESIRFTPDQVTPPPTPVGGGDGDGGLPPPDPTPVPCAVPDTDTDTTKSPCVQVMAVNTMAQNTINTNISHIVYNSLGTGHEYGTSENLNSWPNGNYLNSTVSSDFDESSLSVGFSWDANDGYTINIIHSHPNGDAPSPADVFKLFVNSNNDDLDNAGQNAVNFYKQNAAITVIAKDASYVVTGTDYNTLATLYSQYKADIATFNNNYVQIADNNNGSTEFSLFSIFGNSINIYKSNANSTLFMPLLFDKNGNIITNPCPVN